MTYRPLLSYRIHVDMQNLKISNLPLTINSLHGIGRSNPVFVNVSNLVSHCSLVIHNLMHSNAILGPVGGARPSIVATLLLIEDFLEVA